MNGCKTREIDVYRAVLLSHKIEDIESRETTNYRIISTEKESIYTDQVHKSLRFIDEVPERYFLSGTAATHLQVSG